MTSELTDAMKLRLVADVHVRDETGTPHVFGPDDIKVPRWARELITNPKAWGYPQAHVPGPATAIVSSPLDTDGLAAFIDVVCPGGDDPSGHSRIILARFEAALLLEHEAGSCPARWDWRWTTARVPGVVELGADGHPFPDEREQDQGAAHVVVFSPDGQRKVRFRCCGYDLPIGWAKWAAALDRMRHAGLAEVELPGLCASITK